MSTACIGEPLSHLRLERYALGELPSAERLRVDAHLADCASCRDCLGELRASEIVLQPIPLAHLQLNHTGMRGAAAHSAAARNPWPRSAGTRVALIGSGVALAAVALLALRGVLLQPSASAVHEQHVVGRSTVKGVKGGAVALELVRERAGDVARDPREFMAGDRFAAFVSCPPGEPRNWELVVFQAGQAFFPLSPRDPLRCGNQLQLPGAFLLTGTAPATVCVVLARQAAAPGLDRARISREQPETLSAEHACTIVSPAGH